MKTVMLSLFIALVMAGTALANTLTFAVVDGNNDPANVAEYRIYMKHAGDADSYENVGSVPDENTGLTITFADGYTYSLVATAIDDQGRESAYCAEFLVTFQNGRPTFPDGPMPPSFLILR
jgi:hypothetical protein